MVESGYVYLIEAVGLELIKVGYSSNPRKRLRSLKLEHDVPMRIVHTLPGSRYTERQAHALLHEHRRIGEWFEAEPARASIPALATLPKQAPVRLCDMCQSKLNRSSVKGRCGACLRRTRRTRIA